MNLALRKIIYDPISYIHPQRVSLNNARISNPVLRSITNEMILLQYNLSVEHFSLNSSLIYYINNWNLLPLICLLSGCHFYRERFAERGFFYKVPDVLRNYLSAIPVEINEKARYKPAPIGKRPRPLSLALLDRFPLLSLRDIFPRRGGSLSSKGEPLAVR